MLLLVGGLAYWLILSSSFKLQTVEISEAKNFSTQDLQNLIWEEARAKKFLPTDNLFIFDKSELKKKIDQKYYLDDLKIKIRLPHKLIVSFSEKNYGLIWNEADKFYYINYQGDIILEKNEATQSLTTIFNRGQIKKGERKININEKYLSFADSLNQAFNNQIKGLSEREIFVDDDVNTIKVQIKNGPVIKFNVEEPINKQLIKLETLRREELADGKAFNSKSYIDLRYGDRVFYK